MTIIDKLTRDLQGLKDEARRWEIDAEIKKLERELEFKRSQLAHAPGGDQPSDTVAPPKPAEKPVNPMDADMLARLGARFGWNDRTAGNGGR